MIIRVCVGVLMMAFAVAYYVWSVFFVYDGRVGGKSALINKLAKKVNMGNDRLMLWIVMLLSFGLCVCLESVHDQFAEYMLIYGLCIVLMIFGMDTLPLMAISLGYFVEGARLAFPELVEKIRLFSLDNPWMLLLGFVFCIGMFFFTMNKRRD